MRYSVRVGMAKEGTGTSSPTDSKAGFSATGAKTSTGTPRFSRNATRRFSVSATPSLM